MEKNMERFQKLDDGWIKDNLLGIDWGPSSVNPMTWKEAKEYCASQGGRLPKVNVLANLVDRNKHNPAIDTNFFSDTKSNSWFWTSTEVPQDLSLAWMVDFINANYLLNATWLKVFTCGNINYCNKDSSNYVRPVRSCKS